MTTSTLHLLLPEIVLTAAAVGIYLAGAFVAARRPWSWIAGAALLAAGALLWSQYGAATTAAGLDIDGLARFGRWLALGLGGLLVLLTARPLSGSGMPEYVGSLLLTTAGLMLVAGAGDLVLLFVGLELISIPTYILLYLGRRDAAAQESAAKYFYLSILASAMLLYGFSFLYGVGGETGLAAIAAALADAAGLPEGFDRLLSIGLVLVFAGLGFKMAAVPFHFYAPDVYQGATHANAAVLSVVPKAAAVVVLVRLVLLAVPPEAAADNTLWRVALALAVLSMTFGNVMALWQQNLRRLLAYSSIAHAGYMLVGVAVVAATGGAAEGWNAVGATLFYLAVYAVATVGTFAVLAWLGHEERQIDAVDELIGLGRTRPAAAAMLAVFMFSLTGIPPLAGFWGKLVVFGSALSVDAGVGEGSRQSWFVALAVVGVLNAAVSAAYYLRIVAAMYFRTPLATPKARGGVGARLCAAACALLVVALGVYPKPLLEQADRVQEGATVHADCPHVRGENREDRDRPLPVPR